MDKTTIVLTPSQEKILEYMKEQLLRGQREGIANYDSISIYQFSRALFTDNKHYLSLASSLKVLKEKKLVNYSVYTGGWHLTGSGKQFLGFGQYSKNGEENDCYSWKTHEDAEKDLLKPYTGDFVHEFLSEKE